MPAAVAVADDDGKFWFWSLSICQVDIMRCLGINRNKMPCMQIDWFINLISRILLLSRSLIVCRMIVELQSMVVYK